MAVYFFVFYFFFIYVSVCLFASVASRVSLNLSRCIRILIFIDNMFFFCDVLALNEG